MNLITTFWKQSFVYGIGSLIVRSLSFILLPLYTNYLNQQEVGHIFLLFAFIAFMQIFYNHGLDSAFLKYYGNNAEKDIVGNTIISALYVTSILVSLLIIFISYLLHNIYINAIYTNWLYYCSIILFFDSISNRILTLTRIQNRSIFYLVVNIVNVVSTLLLSYIFVVNYQLGVSGVLLGTLLGSLLRWLLLLPTSISTIINGSFSFSVYKKCLQFGFPFLPAAIFYIIMEMSDRYFILLFLNSSEVGLYSIGYKIGSIGMLIITAFNLGWQPFYNREGNSSDARRIFAQIGSYFMYFIIATSMMIIIWAPIIMRIEIANSPIIGQEFWSAYKIVPTIVLSYIFYAFYIISMPSMYIYDKQKWSPIFRFSGAFSNIMLNIIFIPTLGIMGAAISTALSYFFMTI